MAAKLPFDQQETAPEAANVDFIQPQAEAQTGFRRHAWKVFLTAGLALMGLYYVPAFHSGLLFNLIGLASAIAVLVGVRIHNPKSRLAWHLFAVGLLLFVVGDLFYYTAPLVLKEELSFPSLGDVFYLSVYPALIAGLLILVHRRNPRGDRASLIDALIVTTGLALLAWVFLMEPYAQDSELTLLIRVVSIAYPLMDVLLLAVAIRLSVDTGMRRPALYLLMFSIVSLLATDALFGLASLNGTYNEGSILDLGWGVYYLLWGAAALHPSMLSLEEPSPNRETRLTRSRLALLTAASMTAPAVRLIKTLQGEPLEEPVMIVGTVALFGLVVARMAGLLHEYERSVARERALREAGQALVAASRREEVQEAAIGSMVSLLGPEYGVRLCLEQSIAEWKVAAPEDAEGIEETEWLVDYAKIGGVAGEALNNANTLDVGDIDAAGMPPALRLPADSERALALPLLAREELKGFFLVSSTSRFSRQLRDLLQTLTSKVALALESAVLTEDLHRRESESRFRSLVQNSTDLITVIEADSTIKYQSPSVERVLGYDPEELVGMRLIEILHPHERERVLNVLVEGLDGEQSEAVDCRLRHRDGSWLFFEVLRTNLLHDPNVSGIVLNSRDVSERKAFEEQLTHQAFHDPLTNLANRALFGDRVQHALARQARESTSLGVIFIDLDDFKIINDSLGHGPGDQVLTEVALRMSRCMRPMDTLARFGGDEFAVLLEDVTKPQEVAEVSERILHSLEAPFLLDDKEVFVNASMGIAMVQGEEAMTLGADELLRNADVAMYMAKREGKGHFRVFEPAMHIGVLERLELKGDLQRAIENGEMELHYQPVVALETERISGLEALVRWNHPTRGLIPPLQFIFLAEETGLIVPLGRWVLREACRRAKYLQESYPQVPPLTMAVNISVRQLQHHELLGHVLESLRESGLDPSCLTLEITESVLMHDAESTIVKLAELKALGVRLAVDDFGTGYSSLSYLSQFPVDVLKIDRAFVQPVAEGAEDSALAAAIVKLGEALHLTTIAEGIEDSDQMERLKQLGCGVGQGFYFAKPMDFESIVSFLSSEHSAKLADQT